jgi:hypothetical protein
VRRDFSTTMLSAENVDAFDSVLNRAGSGGPLVARSAGTRDANALRRYVAFGAASWAAAEMVFPADGPANRAIVCDAARAITELTVVGAAFALFAGGCGKIAFFLSVSSPVNERTEATSRGRALNIEFAV